MKNDLISRQAVTKFLNDWLSCLFENCHKQSASDLKMIIKDFKNLPSIQPEQRWIPVSERLPADNTIVQVTFANGKVGQSSWHKENEYNNGFDAVMHGITDRNFVTFGVIAWKPLPEPYQGGD